MVPLARIRCQLADVIVCQPICTAHTVPRVTTGCWIGALACRYSRRWDRAIRVVFAFQTITRRICTKNKSVFSITQHVKYFSPSPTLAFWYLNKTHKLLFKREVLRCGAVYLLYKLALTFESVDEILKCEHSRESY